MGGGAFSALSIPRIPPAVYKNLKARLYPKLVELYTWVGVPIEGPEKLDHGDVDFLVAIPKNQSNLPVSHQVIKEILGAEFMVPMEGNRTSNYAIPIFPGEWAPFGHSSEEEDKRKKATNGQIFYQVINLTIEYLISISKLKLCFQIDIHVCLDKDEWDRIMFYHSYGDLGEILGMFSKHLGLSLGTKGIRVC